MKAGIITIQMAIITGIDCRIMRFKVHWKVLEFLLKPFGRQRMSLTQRIQRIYANYILNGFYTIS